MMKNDILNIKYVPSIISFQRWGQTPLSEAILFKHTKIAAVLKQRDNLVNQLKIDSTKDEVYEQDLWKDTVEGKFMHQNKNPIFKASFNFKLFKHLRDSDSNHYRFKEIKPN